MTEIIIVILIFALSLILIFRNYDYSVYLMLLLSVLLHKELFSFYRWDLMPIRAFMVAVLFASVAGLYFHYLKYRHFKEILKKISDPVFLAVLVLWFIRGISIFFSKNIQASLLSYAFFTTIVFLASYTYLNLKDSPEKTIKFLRFYSYVVFGLTIFGYIQVAVLNITGVTIGALWSIPGNIPRVGASFWDVNHYGALLAATIPFVAVSGVVDKGLKHRVISLLMAISMIVSLFLTNSRSAWIMAFVSLMVFLTVLFVRRFGRRGVLYVLLGVVMLSVPLFAEYTVKSSPFRAKIKQYFHYRMDSFDSHMMLLTGAVQIFEKYPVIGGGYGSFFEHFSKTDIAPVYFGRDPAALNTRVPAHTIWGELLAETGILGFTTFLILCVLIITPSLYLGLKSSDKFEYLFGAASGAVLIGWLTAGIFYSYNSEFFWIIVFFYSAWSSGTALRHISRKEILVDFFWSRNLSVVILFILSSLLIFTSLGKNHLIPFDEAIYAKIAKNMVLSGDYIVQEWVPGTVWYEKPPLYMWMMAGCMKILGFTSLAAKLPGAISGFLLVIAVYLFSKKLYGRVAGFFSAFVLLTTTQFLYYSRMAMLDVTSAFFISVSLMLYYFAKVDGKRILMLLSGLAIGLAVMTKGVVGLLPFVIIFLYEIYLYITKQQKFSYKVVLDYLCIFVTSVLIFLPWHLEMYRIFKDAFINNYIVYHVWDRATSSIEDKGRPFFWYLTVLKVSMRVWFLVLLPAFSIFLFNFLKKQRTAPFLVIWALTIFLFFSYARSKLIWYIIPIYPCLSIMVGYLLSRICGLLGNKVPKAYEKTAKLSFVFIVVLGYLFYLFMVNNLVYTSDLTGSQARLLQKKDEVFGVAPVLYVDRIERPLSLFYTDGPFKIIDFNPELSNRVPVVSYDKQLLLLTKKGRYSENVSGYDYKPQIAAEDGDWILWYFDSREFIDSMKKL